MTLSAGFILVYCIATVVAIASRRARVPYTAALLLTGVAVGALHLASLPVLQKDLLFAVFLPGLLFEASYHLEAGELRANWRTIGALAVPGVVAAIGLTAVLFVGGVSLFRGAAAAEWETALVFGAVIAATDPVAVTALFRQVSAPRRLHVLVESESLLNDGTSIVFLTLLLAFFSGEAPTPAALLVDFVRITVGGAAVGLSIGWITSHVRRQVDDAAIEITLTTIAAYGAFVASEQLGCSGVIATVVAGVVCGHVARGRSMPEASRAAVDSFWEWLAFALNSAVFLLLGAELSPGVLARAWPMVLIGALAALGARAIVVGITGAAVSRSVERVPAAWQVVMTWGGLRGALSLVLALSLPERVAGRALIVVVTGGTVFLSLVGQGASMGALLRRLRASGALESSDT